MQLLLSYYKWLIGFFVLVLGAAWLFGSSDSSQSLITTQVERGNVTELVSVSGFVEAVQSADLGFPAVGRINGVFVTEGQTVTAGELLATLGSRQLAAERQRLLTNLALAKAQQTELQNGPTTESEAVTQSTIAQARTALEQTTAAELQKVKNAQIALRSSNLQAFSQDQEENSPAPVVSGSYTCAEEGTYELSVYRSGAESGFSYRLSGLESGIFTVSTDQPATLGECGLFLQFSPDESYENSQWEILIPNTRSDSYLTLSNAYELAAEQATQNIAAARSALTLAEDQATAANAAPRVEALLQANARVIASQAAIAGVDAQLADNSIIAPFAGTITSVELKQGEVARAKPVMTLIGENAYTVTARIPEIDITRVVFGQSAELTFDAMTTQVVTGVVSFVAPIATEIDGVGYFETTISLDEVPSWLRAGLNADIDIIIAQETDTLRLPNRFIQTTKNGPVVQILKDKKLATTSIDIGLAGNDGYTEVINLAAGTTVVAP